MEISSHLSSHTGIDHLPMEIAAFPQTRFLAHMRSRSRSLSSIPSELQSLSMAVQSEVYFHSNTAGVIDGLLQLGP